MTHHKYWVTLQINGHVYATLAADPFKAELQKKKKYKDKMLIRAELPAKGIVHLSIQS